MARKKSGKPITKEELIAQIQALPDGTEIYTRMGDDAYPTKLRVFDEGGEIGAYIGHRPQPGRLPQELPRGVRGGFRDRVGRAYRIGVRRC